MRPFASAVEKIEECQYFLAMMLENYHEPRIFGFNLNAFIQALRNVTFMLQSEESKPPGFDEWYRAKQEAMRSDPLLKKFVQARNTIVKQQALEARSRCWMGMFRWKRLKLAFGGDVPPCLDSRTYLERSKQHIIDLWIGEDHDAYGEEAGVERIWVYPEIGDTEIVELCINAAKAISEVVREAIQLSGDDHEFDFEIPNLHEHRVLVESDLDPGLIKKWGWDV